MIVTANCGVVLFDRVSIQRLRIFLHPRLELGVGGLFLLDVISHRLFFESQRGERHRIETFANARITGSKLTLLLQGDLLPKPREMQNAKRTGNAGTDQWNVCVAHNGFVNPAWANCNFRHHRNAQQHSCAAQTRSIRCRYPAWARARKFLSV